jgi:hypothetical protein
MPTANDTWPTSTREVAVEFEFDARAPHGLAHRVALFVHREQFQAQSSPIRQFNLLDFVYGKVEG